MDNETGTPAPIHEPPSLPASPLPKRTKVIEPAANFSVAGINTHPCSQKPIHNIAINDVQFIVKYSDVGISGTQDTSRTATPTPAAHPLISATQPTMATTNGTASVSSSIITADPVAVPLLQVKLLSEKAKAPTRGSAFAAGYDIYSAQDTTVPARGKALVDTDIAIAVPVGTCESSFLA